MLYFFFIFLIIYFLWSSRIYYLGDMTFFGSNLFIYFVVGLFQLSNMNDPQDVSSLKENHQRSSNVNLGIHIVLRNISKGNFRTM